MGFIGNLIAGGKVSELTVDDVAARLGQPGFHVFDNNGHGSWLKGHVPGALHLDAGSFVAGDLPADKSATLVFYCSGPS
jgi:rhodanese-related sulfurtransferase